jgi:amino acid adenylation domain-containing protein
LPILDRGWLLAYSATGFLGWGVMTGADSFPAILRRILARGGDDKLALSGGGESVTYGELRRQVLAVREALLQNGIGAGARVAVCLPKTTAAVGAILGILAAGAAYVPLNHRLPLAQLLRILADLRPSLLMTTRAVADTVCSTFCNTSAPFPFRVATVAGSGDSVGIAFLEAMPSSPAKAPASPDDLAVILYTSGTTGEPKGIMLTHSNVAGFVDWAADAFSISDLDRLASHAPFHFDLSIFDIFCGLTRGASVHLIDETMAAFPGAIRGLIAQAGITVWYSVPTALVRLQEREALKQLPSLRLILFAGEVFPTPSLRRLMTDVPAPQYANLYGPTETNVCTYYRLPGPPESDFEQIPIGKPCEHLDVRIIDAAGAPVRRGEIGEICVAGPAVMHGYWGRPETTLAARLPDRADSYRTGDYGYDRGDGALMFVGRRDQQIKVRGHRLELLALETVLNGHPEIREAAALFVKEPSRGGAVAAFLVPRGARLDESKIRAFIEERLPPQYQPDYLEWLPELPQTANGKCDRAGLLSTARVAIGGVNEVNA